MEGKGDTTRDSPKGVTNYTPVHKPILALKAVPGVPATHITTAIPASAVSPSEMPNPANEPTTATVAEQKVNLFLHVTGYCVKGF